MRRIALLLLIPLVGCDDTLFPPPIGGGDGSAITADYAGMQTLFDGECLACHAASTAFGGLDLETDPCSALVSVSAANTEYAGALRVAPGDHSASVIWNKLNGTDVYGQRMPQGGQLDDASIAAVATWIDDGAACDADTGDSGDTDTGSAGLYSFASVQAIFDESCVRCHAVAGENADAEAAMLLTSDVSYASIVGVDALKSTDVRVNPGDPDTSFLWQKVYHQLESGEGANMPKGDGDPSLPPDDLGVIYGWILAGAQE